MSFLSLVPLGHLHYHIAISQTHRAILRHACAVVPSRCVIMVVLVGSGQQTKLVGLQCSLFVTRIVSMATTLQQSVEVLCEGNGMIVDRATRANWAMWQGGGVQYLSQAGD